MAMADVVDFATRSRMMSGIRGKHTSPELFIRSRLHRLGFRFRLHPKNLAGRPDIVLPRYAVAVFVNGCFWHRHAGCKYASNPKTRPEFWQAKFEANVERDCRKRKQLEAAGWRVITVWECALRHEPEKAVDTLARSIIDSRLGLSELPPRS